jgi:hypothetical protein
MGLDREALLVSEEYSVMDEKIDLASSPELSQSEFLLLAKSKNKEVLIALAKNSALPKEVALKLVGTVYLVHKALVNNTIFDDELKVLLLPIMQKNSRLYHQILEKIS